MREHSTNEDDELKLDEAWANLRWTKVVVQAMCCDRLADDQWISHGISKVPAVVADRPRTITPKQRMDQHAKVYKEALKALECNLKQLRTKTDELQAQLLSRNRDPASDHAGS